jgi:hypothetical protein
MVLSYGLRMRHLRPKPCALHVKEKMLNKLFSGFVLGCALMLQSAWGLDVAENFPVMEVADMQLQIGGRRVTLPEGRWHYVGQTQNPVTEGGTRKIGNAYSVYAMDVQNGKMRSGIVLNLPESSFSTSSWVAQPCPSEGTVFRDDFGGNFKTPECLRVYKRSSHLRGAETGLYAQAQQWSKAQAVQLPGPVYDVIYTRYATNDYGSIRVFIPVSAVTNDDEVVAWARQLPAQLRRLFENRDSLAVLPVFPAKPEKIATRLDDVDAIPYLNDQGRQRYREWLKRGEPRAFALSATGRYAHTSGLQSTDEALPSDPVERALVLCNRNSKTPCKLYAVNGAVVWTKEELATP